MRLYEAYLHFGKIAPSILDPIIVDGNIIRTMRYGEKPFAIAWSEPNHNSNEILCWMPQNDALYWEDDYLENERLLNNFVESWISRNLKSIVVDMAFGC